MNKRLKRSLVVALTCAAGAALWLFLAAREPMYQGQSVSFWFAQYAFSFSPKREETVETIAEMGSDAIPYLARMLRKNDSPIGQRYRSYWPDLPDSVKRWLPRPIDPARRHADAATCLSRLGLSYKTAIPPLIEALKDSKPEKRLIGLRSLREVGPRSHEIVLALITAARDPDPIVQRESVGALREFVRSADDGNRLAPAVPLLTDALASPNREIRLDAAYALRDLGPCALEAVPALLAIFQGPNSSHDDRIHAACALGCIHSEHIDTVVPFLVSALESYKDQANLWMVPESLARMAGTSKTVVKALVAFLQSPGLRRDTDDGMWFRTIEAIGQISSAAVEAIPALTISLKDSDERIRLAAALTVWQIDPSQAQTVLPVFLESLRKGTLGVGDVAEILGKMGATAPKEVVPFLTDALRDRDPFTRQAAAQALWRIDPTQAPAIVPVLIEQLARRDVSHLARLNAIQTLGQMGGAARGAAVPLLSENLKNRDRRIQLAAAEALWKIDEGQIPQAVAFLIEHLRRNDCWHREIAADLLGDIGPAAKTSLPALRQAANEDDEKLRASAIDALRKIEAEAAGEARETER